MEYLSKIIDFMINFATSKSQTISKQFLNTIRQIVILVVISLGSMTLFCVGVSMAVSELAIQSDQNTETIFTKPLLIGAMLAVISILSFFYSLSQKAWTKAANVNNESKKNTPSPIEEALGLLIKDIVIERQMKRQSPPATENINT